MSHMLVKNTSEVHKAQTSAMTNKLAIQSAITEHGSV